MNKSLSYWLSPLGLGAVVFGLLPDAQVLAFPQQTSPGSASSESVESSPLLAEPPAHLAQSSLPGWVDNNASGAQASESQPISSVAQLEEYSREGQADAIAQVTSVNQLSDVRPTDWAFEALSRLIENYGCIAGYPDGTYRGNRALTRYEFAAGLNACLDALAERLGSGGISEEDLNALRRLVDEFRSELATLRGRVDNLEARVTELEENQFSTTTRLNGEVVMTFAGATGSFDGSPNPLLTLDDVLRNVLTSTSNSDDPSVPAPAGDDAQITFTQRTRLNLTTSFTGSDALITGLQAYNFLQDPNSIQGTLGYSDPAGLNASTVRLGVEPQFPGTNPQTFGSTIAANQLQLYKLLYIFPSGISNLTLFAGTNAEVSDAFPAITPFASDSNGALSRFAPYNAAYRVSGGTSGTGLASAVGLIWNPVSWLDFRALYGSVNAALPNNNQLAGPNVAGDTALGAGFFGGSSVVAAQLTLRPARSLDIGINYANSYHQINILGTGLAAADIGSILFNPGSGSGDERCTAAGFFPAAGGVGCSGSSGGAVSRGATIVSVASEPIRMNSIGASLTWRFAQNLSFTATGAVIFADLVNVDASTTFTQWMVGLHAQDLFGAGNTAGLIFGQPLAREDTGGSAFSLEDTKPYHLEGFFSLRLNDNISITPGVYFVFNPEGFSDNDTVTVGVVRTTFRF